MTDPIADMLTRIRNAQAVKQPSVLMPYSKVKLEVGKILEREGYVKQSKEFKQPEENKLIKIQLKYDENDQPIIKKIKRISKPGCRVYCQKGKLPRILQGMGIVIVSTSKGLMTDQEARRAGLGGEILCEVY
ncbi:30S ribosomal protein S8 [Patescibacteria group bacterium]|nr:30S ribosomal protein S8 [Patescibacteria group bacterium]